MKHKKQKVNFTRVFTVMAVLIFNIALLGTELFNTSIPFFSKTEAASSRYGVVTFISSLSSSSAKSAATSEASKAGFGWAREEYTYPVNDFAPYDAAYSKLHGSGFKILGLLTYPGGVSHSDWKTYVSTVVDHFPGVSAWEIMNEADNYLSPADYTVYLKEAYTIIKSKGDATVVCSGVTARKEVYPFWSGIKAAGGWDSFDAVGLHMFHDGTPYEDSYNNGTFSQEIQKVVNVTSGKPIWITEMGYDSNNYGLDNEASWLVDSLKITEDFSQVSKVFVFRLYDNGNGLGLLTSSFSEKPAYAAVKNFLTGGGAPAPVASISPSPTPQKSQTPPPSSTVSPTPTSITTPQASATPQASLTPLAIANKDNSSLRLDGADIPAGGDQKFRIVVVLKDDQKNLILDQKPSIILSGGQTELTDFVLIGNEWIAYVASSDPGERTAKISLGAVELGTMKMVFADKISPTPVASPPTISLSDIPSIKNKLFGLKSPFWFYLVGSLAVLGLAAFLVRNLLIRRKKSIHMS